MKFLYFFMGLVFIAILMSEFQISTGVDIDYSLKSGLNEIDKKAGW